MREMGGDEYLKGTSMAMYMTHANNTVSHTSMKCCPLSLFLGNSVTGAPHGSIG